MSVDEKPTITSFSLHTAMLTEEASCEGCFGKDVFTKEGIREQELQRVAYSPRWRGIHVI